MDIKQQFQAHARHVKSVDDAIIDAIWVKITDGNKELYGILWVSSSDEEIDNHCTQCQQDPPGWLRWRKFEDFPEHYSAGIGTTKYNKILSGEVFLTEPSSELKMEMLGSLLEEN
jgi:hypothetical protein